MDVLLSNVDNIKFDIEIDLEEQNGTLPLPFLGMDSKYLIFSIVNFKNFPKMLKVE